jgi:transglutaminase-like putative cysteine protease
VPRGWKVISGTWRAEAVEYEQQENRHIWTARGLAHQPTEPLAPSWHYLSRRLSLSCHDPDYEVDRAEDDVQCAGWKDVADWLSRVYREPCNPTEEIRAQVKDIVDPGMKTEEKIEAIAEFCQDDIRYVAIEVGKNRWLPRPADATLLNRYGDCKDKSVLMIAMLEASGIPAVPVLCNSHYPVDPRVPSPFVFNHVIVAVPVEDQGISEHHEDAVVGDWLFFDPTDPTITLGQLPWTLQGKTVLVGADADSVLLELPYPEPEDFRRVLSARAKLMEDGSFTAQVRVTDFGGSAAYSKYSINTTPEKDRIKTWKRTLSGTVPAVEVEGYSAGTADDSTWATFAIEAGHYTQDAGKMIFLRPNFFQESDKPLLTARERKFPVWFGPPREILVDVVWELPEGWVPEIETPEVHHECEAASIAYEASSEGASLRTRTLYRQNGRLIKPGDYESARSFTSSLNQVNGQVVMIQQP